MQLNKEQKELLSEKALDLINITAGISFFTQLFSEKTNWIVVIVNIGFVLMVYMFAIYLRRS